MGRQDWLIVVEMKSDCRIPMQLLRLFFLPQPPKPTFPRHGSQWAPSFFLYNASPGLVLVLNIVEV